MVKKATTRSNIQSSALLHLSLRFSRRERLEFANPHFATWTLVTKADAIDTILMLCTLNGCIVWILNVTYSMYSLCYIGMHSTGSTSHRWDAFGACFLLLILYQSGLQQLLCLRDMKLTRFPQVQVGSGYGHFHYTESPIVRGINRHVQVAPTQ
jgi:hypothetical protein